MLSSWGLLKRYFIERGSDNCPTALWAILSEQENEISDEANPTYNELYLYFTHNFMSSFQVMGGQNDLFSRPQNFKVSFLEFVSISPQWTVEFLRQGSAQTFPRLGDHWTHKLRGASSDFPRFQKAMNLVR
ncbi:hypothetical protein TNCV_4916251 [Trichonephila clavipes]|nr:hypothetical protein TNCV_4916251 [Trichonephila clavipes]